MSAEERRLARVRENRPGRIARWNRDCLQAAAEQVGVACGFVEVGDSESQVKMRWADRARTPDGKPVGTAETLPVQHVQVETGRIIPNPVTRSAVFTLLENRECVLRESWG